ncbi:hypothetical protein M422DRAFT_261963 [Sphaerobolus stellatus SS14]|uniref:Uncharacterized protein n=1 Tax=Sphaerobolus stellatus (strain SS14) TaxID=990650 RepID=A0A0C9ULL8_SPHS4|nr:hypothetical protein M422DRAFT_261963 [Sphaerobolus stellatus SS14]
MRSRRLRIILHFSPSLLSISPGELCAPRELPLGCSKRSCLCCTLWIEAFNKATRLLWMTSGSHGKSYGNWALPGNVQGVAAELDKYLMDATWTRLVDILEWVPGIPWQGDRDDPRVIQATFDKIKLLSSQL